MRPRFAGLIAFAASAAVTAQVQGHAPGPPPSPAGPQLIIIRDVRVFDGENVLEHRSVLIQGGKIGRIGGPTAEAAGADVIDGRGRTLLPGLIDAHVHLPDEVEAASRQALELGVTTQLDMFSGGDRLRQIKKLEADDRPDLADVRTAGVGATTPGGHPTQMGGPPIPTLTSPEEARRFVDARIAEGSDYIKIIHDGGAAPGGKPLPTLDNATVKALVAAAHQRGKLAVVHAISAESLARDAVSAGADGLAHLFVSESVSPDFGQFVASHHAFVIPTLSTLYLICGKSEGPALLGDPNLSPHIREAWRTLLGIAKPNPANHHLCTGTESAVRQLDDAHVPILTGTDAPVPGSTYGASVHAELTLLVRAGLTPIRALAAATSAPARSFHLADRGWIRSGMRADLLLVEGDPTTDIAATRRIAGVWKRGIRVNSGVTAAVQAAARPGVQWRLPSEPEWRNWQTRGTQNPVHLTVSVGSIPSSGTNESISYEEREIAAYLVSLLSPFPVFLGLVIAGWGFAFAGQVTLLNQVVFPRPNIHAATPHESVSVIVLQARSANAPAVVKLFVEPNKPKSTEQRKRIAKINPFCSPATNVLAPDHIVTVVTRNPTAKEQSTTAQTISWSSGL